RCFWFLSLEAVTNQRASWEKRTYPDGSDACLRRRLGLAATQSFFRATSLLVAEPVPASAAFSVFACDSEHVPYAWVLTRGSVRDFEMSELLVFPGQENWIATSG